MRSKPVSLIVYNHLFPRPRQNDPPSFAVHLARNIIPEVRKETQCFYGTLDGLEAQYPGLDYSFAAHRMRLGRFPWHRRLFRAFDELGLTPSEIGNLCHWEGTLFAKERFEMEEGVTIKDTTGNDIEVWVPSRGSSGQRNGSSLEVTMGNEQDAIEEEDAEESEEEIESVGVELNARLLSAAAARERGADVVLDEEWEQWLKEVAERGASEPVPGGHRWPLIGRLLPQPVPTVTRPPSRTFSITAFAPASPDVSSHVNRLPS